MRAVGGSGERARRREAGHGRGGFRLRPAGRFPGAYVFVGNGDSAMLHNPKYDFNDAAIAPGVAYWVELARRVLPA